jgi:hypothetical protein
MHSLYFGSWILKSIRWCITCYLIRSALGYSQSGPQKDIWILNSDCTRLVCAFFISLKINLFSPWYSWKIVELALNNNHSFTKTWSKTYKKTETIFVVERMEIAQPNTNAWEKPKSDFNLFILKIPLLTFFLSEREWINQPGFSHALVLGCAISILSTTKIVSVFL